MTTDSDTIETPRSDDPEGILLYGIERLAKKGSPESGGGYLIIDAVSANSFAGDILLLYWKAKALKNGN